MADSIDPWESGEQYQVFMGRWSSLVAREFLGWLAVPAARRWLDVGCGTGTLSRLILDEQAALEMLAVDPSAEFVSYTAEQLAHPAASFRVGAAGELPAGRDRFDAVVSGLVLNFIPDVASGLSEMRRVARDGGVIAAYVWDYAGKMDMLRYFWDAAAALDPAAAHLDEGRRFPLCHPERLEEAFLRAGLGQVQTRPIDIPTRFEDFEAFWRPFLGGIGPAGGYVAGLDSERLTGLKAHLQETVPISADGGIDLIARAWAVRGVK